MAGIGSFLVLAGALLAAAVTGGASLPFTATTAGWISAGLIVAGNIYGGVEARRAARRVAARQRAEYNANLQDRMVTVLRADPPWHVAYGRGVKGGFIIDIFTSDKVGVRDNGDAYTRADGLKHMVVVFASHRCQAINEVYIEGVAVGALDVDGYPTGGDFKQTGQTATRIADFTGSITLAETPLSVVQAFSVQGALGDEIYTTEIVTISGNDLLCGEGHQVTAIYTVSTAPRSVRISKHLGSDTEAVDTIFAGIDGARYTSSHGLRGLTAICVTLDLEDQRFQGGPPNFTGDISGALVYDPRQDSTAGGSGSLRADDPSTWVHSSNPALCIRDFLTQPYGFNAAADEIDSAKLAAAADACDAPIDLVVGAVTASGQPRYTCNGSFTTEASAEATLEDLARCMAGTVVYGADWQVNAGAWVEPVLALTDDDLRGAIEVVQADTPLDALFNGLRGRYVPFGGQGPTDVNPPYQNAAFVTADGEELWHDIELPFTDDAARVRNLARIFTEQARAGQVLRVPAKLRAWVLQVGDRVTLSSTELGLDALEYRVTDWQFDVPGGVLLTLQRDYETIWDLADAADALPAPNTNLPNPWVVGAITGLAATSGTGTLNRSRDGTITPRVLVSWDIVTEAYVVDGGHVDIQYRRNGDVDWQRMPDVRAAVAQAWISGVNEGDFITIRANAVNKWGQRSIDAVIGHQVVGKSQVPDDVTGFAAANIPGGAMVSWDASTELDYRETEVRVGASWGAGLSLYKGSAPAFVWHWPVAGSYTLRAKHRDTSGNESASEATASITIDDSSLIGTGELGPAAATEIFTDTHDFAGATIPSGTGGVQRTLTFTPAADCEIEFSFLLRATGLYADAGNQVQWQITPSGGSTTLVDSSGWLNSTDTVRLLGTGHFAATGGVAHDLEVKIVRAGGTITLYESYLRATCVKR